MKKTSESAQTKWDELVSSIPNLDSWVDEAIRGQEPVGLFRNGIANVRVARPDFITGEQWDQDQEVVTAVAAGLVAAGDQVLRESALEERYFRDWLADPNMAQLSRLDPGYTNRIVLGRFDGIRQADGMQIMEFNGGLPGGALAADLGARYMASWPNFPEFNADFPVEIPEVRKAVVAAWIDTWHDFGGSGTPRTVIALPEELRDLVLPALASFEESEQRSE